MAGQEVQDILKAGVSLVDVTGSVFVNRQGVCRLTKDQAENRLRGCWPNRQNSDELKVAGGSAW